LFFRREYQACPPPWEVASSHCGMESSDKRGIAGMEGDP
jgi:hypothetical protein